jgi:hypothetical protein
MRRKTADSIFESKRTYVTLDILTLNHQLQNDCMSHYYKRQTANCHCL